MVTKGSGEKVPDILAKTWWRETSTFLSIPARYITGTETKM
jgi:hypothetical protein